MESNDFIPNLAALQRQQSATANQLAAVLAYAQRENVSIDLRLLRITEALLDGEMEARGLLIEQVDPVTGKVRKWYRDKPSREHRRASRRRCYAITRRGTRCKCEPVRGKTRCKFHGGLATGPKSAEGRARIAEANRRRKGTKYKTGKEAKEASG